MILRRAVLLATLLLAALLLPGAAHAQGMFARPGDAFVVTPFAGFHMGLELLGDFTRTGNGGEVEGTSREELGAGFLGGVNVGVPLAGGVSLVGGLGLGRTGTARLVIRTRETTVFGTRDGASLLVARLGLAWTLPLEVPIQVSLSPSYFRVDPGEEANVAPELTVPYAGWALHGGVELAFPVSEHVSWTVAIEDYYVRWDAGEQESRAEVFYERELGLAVEVAQDTRPGHVGVLRLGLAITP